MLKCIKSDYFHDFDDFEDKQGKEKKKEKEKKKRKEKKKKEKKKEKRNELGGKEFDSKPNLNQRAVLLPSLDDAPAAKNAIFSQKSSQ